MISRPGPALRVVLACAACAVVALLAWPPDASETTTGTVAALLAPLAPGGEVARGYALDSVRRGEERDVVLVARRAATADGPGAGVEVHLVDRGQWSDVLETASFGIGYETPRSSAPEADCVAVTRAVEGAVRVHDPGGLGPVDAMPLDAAGTSPEPWIARALLRLSGWRGVAVGFALVMATWLLASMARMRAWTAAWLALVGLALRLPELGLPFDRDQDVQRLFTGHLPVFEILTGAGLLDRHPPLYFLVLHAAQVFGQSETVARAPAAIAGALVGPAVFHGAWVSRRRAGPAAALVALAAALSVELVRRSRECSDIPLFALLAVAASATLVRAAAQPSGRWRAAVVASHALALWTYYLAPLVVAGNVAMARLAGLRSRPALRAVALGVLLGAPSLGLEVAIFVRDSGARTAADTNPALAWGRHGVAEMLAQQGRVAIDALGVPMLVVVSVVALAALLRRRAAVLVPLGALAAAYVGVALVAPFARVQAYYVDAVLPLAALAAAAGMPARRRGTLAAACVGLVVAVSLVPRLRGAHGLYEPSREASMPALAEAIDRQPERRVLVTADYDTTLLAYYLARRHGVAMDWDRMVRSDGGIRLQGLEQELVPLVRVHMPGPDPDGDALAKVEQETRGGAVLVLARDGLGLARLDARLARCASLATGVSGCLLRCP